MFFLDGARMFYSKFSYRHYMAELLMYVTKFEPYVKSLQAYSMFFFYLGIHILKSPLRY